MHHTVENLRSILNRIDMAAREAGFEPKGKRRTALVAVSKTFSADEIRPVLEAGHRLFGENRVQEAQSKWPDLRKDFPDIELHLIGPLQSNKAAEAVALFDVIETVDREKIAAALAAEMRKQDRHPRLLVQVNTGAEPQKAGIAPEDTLEFVANCREKHGLEIEGLMCIPPADENPGPHFALLTKLAGQAGVEVLSMGMSGDFEIATGFGATHVRVGSAIFGSR
ncbi:MAG: YggS family pyridoxal phosphate-dependent enzyme [Nitratireductor sp.]